MELLAACQLVLGLLNDQKLTVSEHGQVERAFNQVAPKCQEEFKKKAKEDKK